MEHIAVIGAGMAGLSAARALSDAGRRVQVIDKSRGVGGRLATRRSDAGSFDHGAPVAQGTDPAFRAAMAGLGSSAVRQGDGWRGLPGMSGLLKPWLDGIERHGGTRIIAVEDRGDAVHLEDADGERHGPFEAVVIAIPVPQLADLVAVPAPEVVKMLPVWTLMAAWDENLRAPDVPPAPFDTIVAQGRSGAFVAHARPDWSEANLERDKLDIGEELAARLGDALGVGAAPYHAVAHRWRFGRVATPMGVPFLRVSPRILAGGDWALGPLAGDAWRSGRAMAATLLGLTDAALKG